MLWWFGHGELNENQGSYCVVQVDLKLLMIFLPHLLSAGTTYDLSASQVSPNGRVFQVKYAMKAVENSSTDNGIRCKDGRKIVLCKLYEEGSTNDFLMLISMLEWQ